MKLKYMNINIMYCIFNIGYNLYIKQQFLKLLNLFLSKFNLYYLYIQFDIVYSSVGCFYIDFSYLFLRINKKKFVIYRG